LQLQQFFQKNPKIAVAFSGGVDSSYLLYAADAAGCDVHAYFIKSEFQPQFELDEVIYFTKNLDVPLTVENYSVLHDPFITENTPDRCYKCKTKILNKLWMLARENGYKVLCDGTNADDVESDRPGMKALREQGVLSPLRDCGLGKQEIRFLSKQAGLPTHDKPAYACLATRVPVGTQITIEILNKIERSEDALFKMGFSDFRVRLLPPDIARLQIPNSQWNEASAQRKEILEILRPYFCNVVLDMESR